MADKCDPIRSSLKKLQDDIELVDRFLVDGEGGTKPKLNPAWKKLNQQIVAKQAALKACEESLIPDTPVPLALMVSKIKCVDQSDEIRVPFGVNTADDEPYVVAFAVDVGLNGLVPGAINSKMTLVGPLSDVDAGDLRTPPHNRIWGLSGVAQKVTSADGLLVITAFLENDSGNAAQARSVLEKAAQVALLANLPAFASGQILRDELVRRIAADMAGAMSLATAGVPDPDDHIGSIQEVRFSQAELDRIYRNLGHVEKTLTYSGDDARYRVTYRLFRES